VRGVAGALLGVENEVNLLDMEASIEHLGRGTPGEVDDLLVVVEPYYRALETAGRIAPLARELGIGRILAVANKIRDDEDARVIREYLSGHGIELVAEIPFDDAVRDADRRGLSLIDVAPESDSVRAMTTLAARLAA
jgi:CO dehydrogenase maturation factor